MKKLFFACILSYFLCSYSFGIEYENMVPGEVLVKFKPSVSASAIKAMGFQIFEASPKLGVFKMTVPEGKSLSQFIEELRLNNTVIFAEPNHIIKEFATTPNDPSYSLQWGLPLIHAPDAWDTTKGDPTVIVAVIDSGIDTTHPDLKNKISSGWNFYDNNSDYSDVTGHGSHVSGIIAAETNNSIGIAGVSWLSKIMALRIMNSLGKSTDLLLANAIIYAADNGAKVINMSLGGTSFSQTQADAVSYAYGKGCVMAAATGNDGNSVAISYPAALPQVMAVTAVDKSGIITSYSNTGTQTAVCAPGGTSTDAIYSTLSGNTYGYEYGTSMATPHVAGLAALLFSRYPTITRDQVIYAITSEAENPNGSIHDNSYGWGLINLSKSLGDPISPEVTILKPDGTERLLKNESFAVKWSASDSGGGLAVSPISIFFSLDNGSTYSTVASSISNTGTYSWTVPQTPVTQGKIKISAIDSAGNITTKESNSFSILDLNNGIYVYPIPANAGSTITFLGLFGDETIRIYDIGGDLIKTITSGNTWDTKDDRNNISAEGIYFYVVSSSAGVLKTGKLIITK